MTGNAQNAIETEASSKTETTQERMGRLASAVVKELRKGVDVGSVAAARAQAIRRYSVYWKCRLPFDGEIRAVYRGGSRPYAVGILRRGSTCACTSTMACRSVVGS